MPHRRTPQRMYRWSMRVLMATGPLAVFTLLAWLFRWIPDARPFAVLMLYLLLLLVAVAAGCVAALSAIQLAIQHAFRAGFQTGQASVEPGDLDPLERARRRRERGDGDPLLHLVE